MTAYINGKIDFYVWPLNIDTKSKDILESVDIHVYNREIEPIHNKEYNEHTLILEHIKRSTQLANLITQTIIDILHQHNITDYSEVIIANEGFSFGSKGDSILDLSGYKYILMYTLIKEGFNNFRTYSPMSIKSVAGCAKRGCTKVDMINRLGEEDRQLHKLFDVIHNTPDLLKKKTNYCQCLDDIADSYWCLKKVLQTE